MMNTNEVNPAKGFEMNPMKRFQMLCSWSEFYFANKNKDKHTKIQKDILKIRDEITKLNSGFKK